MHDGVTGADVSGHSELLIGHSEAPAHASLKDDLILEQQGSRLVQ